MLQIKQNTRQTTPVTVSSAMRVVTITYNNPSTITRQQVVSAVNALTGANKIVRASVTTAGMLLRLPPLMTSGMLSGGTDAR